MNKITGVLIAIFFISGISVFFWHHLHGVKPIPDEKWDAEIPLVPLPYFFIEFQTFIFIMFILYISYIVFVLIMNYRIPTPYESFMLIAGAVWGVISAHDDIGLVFTQIVKVPIVNVMYVFIPATVFNLAFCMDFMIFLKALPQIMLIGAGVSLVAATVFGVTVVTQIDDTMGVIFGIFFGFFCMPTNPRSIMHLLKQQSLRTKHIGVLLEGEAICTYVLADIMYLVCIGFIRDHMVHWYQYVMVFSRLIFIGLLEGYIFGLISRCLIRKMSSNKLSVCLIFFGMPFLAFSCGRLFGSGCGSMGVAVMGLMMGLERTVLNIETGKFLKQFWEMLGFMADAFLCARCGIEVILLVLPYIEWSDYIAILVVYLVYYVVRFIVFILFSPALSRLGYGMDFKNMLVCVWSGLRSPFSILIISSIFDYVPKSSLRKVALVYFCTSGLYFFSNLINGTFTRVILEFLGLRQISLTRQANMSNSLRHIFNKREQIISILKLDRFLADTDWALIKEVTTIQHPYHIELTDVEEEFTFGYRFTYCPECKKDVEEEPTAKELAEMRKEACMRILKAKKMTYSRQFEKGMVSKHGIRFINQLIQLSMDVGEYKLNVPELQDHLFKMNFCVRCFRRQLERIEKRNEALRRPKYYWRRVCYYMVVRKSYLDIIIFVVLISNIVFIGIDWSFHCLLPKEMSHTEHSINEDYIMLGIKSTFLVIYIIEMLIKILAYAYEDICEDGCHNYFKFSENYVDILVIVVYSICVGVNTQSILLWNKGEFELVKQTRPARLIINTCQVVVVLKLLFLFRVLYPIIIKCLDQKNDTRMALGYEIGKSYVTSHSEVIEMLPYMIDNKKVRAEMAQQMDCDRLFVVKLLGMVQKDKPWVAITVKTKQAIRTILSGMSESLKQLKISGWVDKYEYDKLHIEIERLFEKVNAITMVQPSSPKIIFKEVSWMAEDEDVINFLFENVTVKSFEPEEIVFGEGHVADGIYIVVTGLFMVNYKPDKNYLTSLHEFGRLPIVDYLTSSRYKEASTDYIVTGNCIGELSFLTERPYNCVVKAETHSQVYVLSTGVLKRAMELSPDPVTGLECRIWKEVSVRIAVPLLLATPAYQSLSEVQVKYALERAFVPNLSRYKIFGVTDMIEDMILIEGVVADFNTRELFIAPCCIPRTAQKLILPTSSLMNLPFPIETKLLIIPEKDLDEYDVMFMAEDTCELVSAGSESKCLQHIAQDKIRNKKRKLKGKISNVSRQKHISKRISHMSSRGSSSYSSKSVLNSLSSHHTIFKESSAIDVDDEEKKTLDYRLYSQQSRLNAFE